MKKYVKPVFIAESYMFAYSIAACSNTAKRAPLVINQGDNLCKAGCDQGHQAGNNQNNTIDFPITIFNDEPQNIWQNKDDYNKDPDSKTYQAIGCDFDWDGKDKSFSQYFYGNGASASDQHIPSYKGSALPS